MAGAKQLYTRFAFVFPLLIAFILPFGINYSPVVILWALCFFCFQDLKQSFKMIFANTWSYVFFAFFLIHVIGYFFSDNKTDALTAIEIKLSFFAIPLLLFSSDLKETEIKTVLVTFVSACFLACLLCLVRASYLLTFEHTNAFFYSDFTFLMHPSYFAMYLIFSQLVIILYYKKWLAHLSSLNVKIGLVSLVLLICIFLCSSKMGLICAALLIPSTLSVLLYQQGYKKTILGMYALLIAGVTVAYKVFPTPFERLKTAFTVTASASAINKTDAESTAVRILIWQESVKLIKQHMAFGVSPGDVNDELNKVYEEQGLTGALKKHLNAHNQFLQTFLGTGIIGFVLLLVITLGLIGYGIYKKQLLMVLFGCLITLNFLVESMLQAQAGFMFFTFFVCFFLRYHLSNFTNQNTHTT